MSQSRPQIARWGAAQDGHEVRPQPEGAHTSKVQEGGVILPRVLDEFVLAEYVDDMEVGEGEFGHKTRDPLEHPHVVSCRI